MSSGTPALTQDEAAALAEELAYRLRQQELLAAFAMYAAQRRPGLDPLLHEATRVSAEALKTSLCKVLELQPGQRLLVRAGVGWADGVVGHATIASDLESPAGYALRTGQPVICNQLSNETRFRTPDLLARHGVHRAINVLIPDGASPYGVLEADSPDQGRFTRHDVAFMQGMANLLGMAIERQNAEHRLSESERSFRSTVTQAAVGVALVGTDGKWLRVNERLCAITGHTSDELLQLDFQALTHPDDLPTGLVLLQSLLAGERDTATLEKRYLRKDGAAIWVSVTISLVRDEAGAPRHFIAVVEDIDARKRAETALQQLNATLEQLVTARTADLRDANERLRREMIERQRAEAILRHAQKMKAIGELTSGIAHDFNNVLTTIGGSVELAMRSEGETARRRLALAITAVERGARLTRDLLSFSRDTALSNETLDLHACVDGMRELLDRSLGDLVRVTADLPGDLWPARADADQLELAILNAAVNARDAMEGGGTFRITAANRALPSGTDAVLSGDFVELALTDTGPGMPAEVAERAFEPFFTTKARGAGTGLGLAQIYAFATQSGGTARIDSAPAEGTTIRLFLPAAH